jgi:hypothetical protein
MPPFLSLIRHVCSCSRLRRKRSVLPSSADAKSAPELASYLTSSLARTTPSTSHGPGLFAPLGRIRWEADVHRRHSADAVQVARKRPLTPRESSGHRVKSPPIRRVRRFIECIECTDPSSSPIHRVDRFTGCKVYRFIECAAASIAARTIAVATGTRTTGTRNTRDTETRTR